MSDNKGDKMLMRDYVSPTNMSLHVGFQWMLENQTQSLLEDKNVLIME